MATLIVDQGSVASSSRRIRLPLALCVLFVVATVSCGGSDSALIADGAGGSVEVAGSGSSSTPSVGTEELAGKLTGKTLDATDQARVASYQSRFDAVYAKQKSRIDSLASSVSGPYELLYAHYALNEMYLAAKSANLQGADAYALESLRLMEVEVAHATNVDSGGYLNWELNHRQVEYHFAMEASRLCRILLSDANTSSEVRQRLLKIRDFIIRNVIEKWVDSREPGTLDYYIRLSDQSKNSQALGDTVMMLASVMKEVAATLPASDSKAQRFESAADAMYAGFRTRFSQFSPPGPAGTMVWDAYANYSYSGVKNNGYDTSHALRQIIAIRTGYEHQVPGYTKTEAAGLAKLLGYLIWNQSEKTPLYTNYVNGTNYAFVGHAPWVAGNIATGWPWLAQFDPQAAKAMSALYEVRKANGSVPSSIKGWSDNAWADLSIAAALIRATVSGVW